MAVSVILERRGDLLNKASGWRAVDIGLGRVYRLAQQVLQARSIPTSHCIDVTHGEIADNMNSLSKD